MIAFAIVLLALAARQSLQAQWGLSQLPDLTTIAVDTLAGYQVAIPGTNLVVNPMVTDDFICPATGRVTTIRLWGTWLNDTRDTNASFSLAIFANLPAGVDGVPYARPGNLLWQDYRPATHQTLESSAASSFYDPGTRRVLGVQTQTWRLDFELWPALAFEGTPGATYWLGVQAHSFNSAIFGWRTRTLSVLRSGSSALTGETWAFGTPPPLGWNQIHFPAGEAGPREYRDLAFSLATPPPPLAATLAQFSGEATVLTLSWTNSGNAVRLESTGALTGAWNAVSTPLITNANWIFTTVTNAAPAQFLRLRGL